MKLHKEFINELGKRRKATVGDIVVALQIITIKDNIIQNLNDNLDQLEQIFYSADYLLDNDLVIQERHIMGEHIPDFNPENFIKDKERNYFRSDRIHAMPKYLDLYWGREYLVRPVYYKMIENGYKTDQEKKEFWQFWLPIIVAILAALSAGLFTKLFDMLFRLYNPLNCLIWLK